MPETQSRQDHGEILAREMGEKFIQRDAEGYMWSIPATSRKVPSAVPFPSSRGGYFAPALISRMRRGVGMSPVSTSTRFSSW